MSKITLRTNLASLNAQRRLATSTRSLADSFTHLSSGLRINKASDDAAGLSIANGLNVDRRVFQQGVLNFNDGVSLLNIAEGALNGLSSLTIRIEELASQSANGTLGSAQRKALDDEAQALSAEYSRIVQTTEFNGQKILDSNFQSLTLQGGYGARGSITINNIGMSGNAVGSGLIGDGTFAAATTLATGIQPASVTTGDFNGDGNLDLTSADLNSNRLSVFLGNGDGTFAAATTLATGSFPGSITTGDFNGDGNLDLTSADSTSSQLSVFLGNGDGTFAAATTLATGGAPVSVTTGDFNGDGALDLTSADRFSDQLSVFLGNGDGTFAAATTVATGISPRSVRTGDFNGDGNLDLTSADTSSNQLSVFLGNGDGTFAAATTVATGSLPQSVTTGDFNGDGNLDLTSADDGSNQLSVFLGNGDGSFAVATTVATGSFPRSVAAGDFNGDGNLDLTSADDGSNQLSVFLGNGDGTFAAATTLATGLLPRSVTTGDFNGDGALDLTSGDFSGNRLSIFLANTQAASSFTSLPTFNLRTQNSSLQAISLLEPVRNQIATQRGNIGSGVSRLQTGINNLKGSAENFAAAESRIVDVDVAEESSNLIKSRILQQIGTAILSQANLSNSVVANLLQSA